MALSTDDFQYFDGKFGEMHKRISVLSEDVARLDARPCPDVRDHVGTYHRRNGDGNGRSSYPTVQPDALRSTSWSSILKLWGLILGVIAGTVGLLKGFGF